MAEGRQFVQLRDFLNGESAEVDAATKGLKVLLVGGDIQIGAVELKDAASADRAVIRSDGDAIPAGPDDGALLLGGRDVDAATLRHLRVSTGGQLLVRQEQAQNIETTAALGAGGSFTSTERVNRFFESFAISLFLEAGASAMDVDVFVEQRQDGGATWRILDQFNLSAPAGDSVSVDRVYSVTRERARVRLVNNDGANALAATELVLTQKPWS